MTVHTLNPDDLVPTADGGQTTADVQALAAQLWMAVAEDMGEDVPDYIADAALMQRVERAS